jgi:dTDP-4-dehydrorhamnose 3,5-epimerase
MPLTFSETELKGVVVIESDIYEDERGFFREIFHTDKHQQLGQIFVQDNHSYSKKAALRGLHYQLNSQQSKLVTAITGEIFDVAVDIRKGSPTFGKWTGTNLSSLNKRQIYIPKGFAHGFCVLSDRADVLYKCTDLYVPGDEYRLLWSDSMIDIDWPVSDSIVSDKDSRCPALDQIPEELLPVYKA